MITITDVATKAGVARSTVSYVLNQSNTTVKISERTRRKVVDAAQELGYHRNELARAVTTGRNSVLGFWVMNAQREPDVRILAGAMREAEANRHFIKMLSLDSSGSPTQIADHCIDWQLAGIIAISSSREIIETVQAKVARFHIPIVMVEGEQPSFDCLHVTSQEGFGIAEAVRHLAGLGHRKIAFIGGSLPSPTDAVPNKREESYRHTLHELGLDSFVRVGYSNWDFETTRQVVESLLESAPSERPTAICCVCDHVAMMVISASNKMGFQVPHDLSVTGFDDLAVASIYNPP